MKALMVLIKKLINAKLEEQFILGTVISKDVNNGTCTVKPLTDAPEFNLVRMYPEGGGTELEPELNSVVGITRLGAGDWNYMVVLTSKLTRIKLLTTDNAGAIELNGDNFGGLVKYNELKQELDKVKQFIEIFSNVMSVQVVEPGNGAPSALQFALQSAYTAYTAPNFENKTNNNIKHGGN